MYVGENEKGKEEADVNTQERYLCIIMKRAQNCFIFQRSRAY